MCMCVGREFRKAVQLDSSQACRRFTAGFVRGGEFSISCGSWNLMDRLGGVVGGGGHAAGGGEHSIHVWKYHAAVLCAGHES